MCTRFLQFIPAASHAGMTVQVMSGAGPCATAPGQFMKQFGTPLFLTTNDHVGRRPHMRGIPTRVRAREEEKNRGWGGGGGQLLVKPSSKWGSVAHS